MKKFLFFTFMLFSCFFVNAQDSKTDSTDTEKNKVRPNIIKINPLGLIVRNFNASFEHRVNNKGSIKIGLSYFNWQDVWNADDDFDGFCGQFSYRFYFSRTSNAPHGLFIAPIIEIGSISSNVYASSTSFDPTTKKSLLVSAGFRGGYQWVFSSGVTLDLFTGYSHYYLENSNLNSNSGSNPSSQENGNISLPTLGVAVGYNF